MPESVVRAPQSQLGHARLKRGRFEAQLLRCAAKTTNPPPGAVEHSFDVLLLHVREPDTAARGGVGALR